MDIIIKMKSISEDFAFILTYDLENFGIELQLFAHPIFCLNLRRSKWSKWKIPVIETSNRSAMTITTHLKTWFKVYLKYGISQIGLTGEYTCICFEHDLKIFLLSDMTLTHKLNSRSPNTN